MTDEITNVILGVDEKEKNAVESLLSIFKTPIAKRRGINFSASECREWADELEIYLSNTKYN